MGTHKHVQHAGRAVRYAGGWLLLVCLSLFGISGTQSWAQAPALVDGIAAIVNDDIVTISEVFDAMAPEMEQLSQQYSGALLQDRVKTLFRRTLTNLTDLHLQLSRARQLNLKVSEDDVNQQIDALKKQNQIADAQFTQLLQSRGLTLEAYKKQIQDGLLVAKVVNAEVRSRLTVLDTELQEAYQARQERYRTPGEQTVSHILFLFPENATPLDEERLRLKAEGVLQQLHQGGDFAALARQYSDGPSAETGGLLGTFRVGELLPGFEEAAAKLQPGQISDVVRTRIGWHIIRVDSRKKLKEKTLEDVQEEIKSEILREKTERKYQEWIETLRQQAYVKVLHEG